MHDATESRAFERATRARSSLAIGGLRKRASSPTWGGALPRAAHDGRGGAVTAATTSRDLASCSARAATDRSSRSDSDPELRGEAVEADARLRRAAEAREETDARGPRARQAAEAEAEEKAEDPRGAAEDPVAQGDGGSPDETPEVEDIASAETPLEDAKIKIEEDAKPPRRGGEDACARALAHRGLREEYAARVAENAALLPARGLPPPAAFEIDPGPRELVEEETEARRSRSCASLVGDGAATLGLAYSRGSASTTRARRSAPSRAGGGRSG